MEDTTTTIANLSEDAFLRGDFKVAKELFEEELKTNSGSSIYWHLAYCHYKLKEYSKAEIMCKKSLEMEPERAETHLILYSIYGSQKKEAEAEAEARKALELDGTSHDAYVALARSQITRRDFLAAEETLQTALEMKLEDWYTHFLRGFVFRATKRQEDAFEEFKKSYKLNPIRSIKYSMIYQYLVMQNLWISIFIASLIVIGFFTKIFPLLLSGVFVIFIYGVIDIFIKRIWQAIVLFVLAAIILGIYYSP